MPSTVQRADDANQLVGGFRQAPVGNAPPAVVVAGGRRHGAGWLCRVHDAVVAGGQVVAALGHAWARIGHRVGARVVATDDRARRAFPFRHRVLAERTAGALVAWVRDRKGAIGVSCYDRPRGIVPGGDGVFAVLLGRQAPIQRIRHALAGPVGARDSARLAVERHDAELVRMLGRAGVTRIRHAEGALPGRLHADDRASRVRHAHDAVLLVLRSAVLRTGIRNGEPAIAG